MSGRIFIEPNPRKNPDGLRFAPWRIMLEENGKVRHTNDAPDYASAVEKAERAAQRRGLKFRDDGNTSTKVESSSRDDEPSALADFMNIPRPRGAPDIGARIVETLYDDTILEGVVAKYLSTQFVYVTDTGHTRICPVSGQWRLAGH